MAERTADWQRPRPYCCARPGLHGRRDPKVSCQGLFCLQEQRGGLGPRLAGTSRSGFSSPCGRLQCRVFRKSRRAESPDGGGRGACPVRTAAREPAHLVDHGVACLSRVHFSPPRQTPRRTGTVLPELVSGSALTPTETPDQKGNAPANQERMSSCRGPGWPCWISPFR